MTPVGNSLSCSRPLLIAACLGLIAAGAGLGMAGAAAAQGGPQASPPSADAAAPPLPAAAPMEGAPAAASGPQNSGSFPAQPPPAFKPGFLHQLVEWWNNGFADFSDKMKSAKDRLDDINRSPAAQDALKSASQVTKDAATAIVRLPNTRVFELHDRCPPAGNGAPDCQTAAANACRGRGFSDGQPLDVSTAQDCPARAVLSGEPAPTRTCHDETTILRVVCQ